MLVAVCATCCACLLVGPHVLAYDFVTELVGPSSCHDLAIAVNASGDPFICCATGSYGSEILVLATRADTGWTTVTIDESVPGVGIACSIALDGGGYPHVSYREPVSHEPGRLKYAYEDAAGWHTETVDGDWVPREATSIAIDGSGVPHIAYQWSSGYRYAYKSGGAWLIEDIDAGGDINKATISIAIGSNGYPRVAYGMCISGAPNEMRYAYRDASGWHAETAYVIGDGTAYSCSLALLESDVPHIAFAECINSVDPDSEGLVHASEDGPDWHIDYLVQGDNRVYEASLDLDASDLPYITYCDNDVDEVRLTHFDGLAWQTETVKVGAETYLSFCLDSEGRPHVASGSTLAYSYVDTRPPLPDPPTWQTVPYNSDQQSVAMEVSAVSDPSGVEYSFEETSGNPGGSASGWQAEATYTDSSLDDSTEYCYRVKARDSLGNETGWSTTECATVLDTTPPRMYVDALMACDMRESSPGEISMCVDAGGDPHGVEFYFEETTGNPGGSASEWQASHHYTDTGLSEGYQYCYRVKARDLSANLNESDWCGTECTSTADVTPPTPDPMRFVSYPQALGERTIRMVATTATDPKGVDYYFTETSGNPRGTWSVWQESTELIDWGLQPNTTYCYQVRARDGSSNQNETANSVELCVKTERTPNPTGAPGMDWTRFSNNEDPAYDVWWMKLVDVAVDPDGNIYAVGDFEWQSEDPGWVGQAMVTKWAPDGTRLWHEIFELPDIYCHPRAACTDAAGNLYIVGIWAPPESTPWPGWFLTKMSPDGRDVSTYSSDSSWVVLYSVDVDAGGDAYVCGNFWVDGWFTGRFDFVSGSFVWTRGYAANPDTANIEAVYGVLGPDGYYAAKNYTSDGIDATLMARHRLADGIVESNAIYDLAAGTPEQVTALDVDAYGQIVGTVWALDSNSGQIVRFGADLDLHWNMTVTTDVTPYMTLRDVVVGPDWKIHAVGRESNVAGWWETDVDSHAFAFCLTGDGTYLWDHTYDPGGAGEGEWGSGEGVGCAPDGSQTYVGATLLYSGTGWEWSLGLLAYGDAPVLVQDEPTAAAFLVKTATGDVRADGSVFATDFRTGAADVAEWVCVSEPAAPGDVLEHDPDRPSCYRLSSGPASSLIAGVVSTEPGVVLGEGAIDGDRALLALTGIVPVKVTGAGGPIRTGDLLVSSSTPGHAMRWAGDDGCLCTLVGKALEPMTGDSGVILVLLTAH